MNLYSYNFNPTSHLHEVLRDHTQITMKMAVQRDGICHEMQNPVVQGYQILNWGVQKHI